MRWSARVPLFIALFAISAAQAGVILVSESGLGANGAIDLTTLPGSFASANTAVNGIPGLTVGITDTGNSFQRLAQGSGWGGNFAPGEPLLWTAGQNGPITLTFSSPVTGVGMQVQPDFYGSYWAMLEAFDPLGYYLGWVSRNDGMATNAGNDSAIFIGIRSDSANIGSVRISLPVAYSQPLDFAINGPQVLGGEQVPEPASFVLFGAGGLVLLAFARRRRSA